MDVIPLLTRFGLTHQEARLFLCLHSGGEATGYELAKESGISRSNVYGGLSSLVEKGAANRLDGNPVRYAPVEAAEFCRNVIRGLERAREELVERLPPREEGEEGYLTIEGRQNICNKVETLISQAQLRIYLSMAYSSLLPFLPALKAMAEQGKKVVVITDRPVEAKGVTVYPAGEQGEDIRVIGDSLVALTGTLSEKGHCTCLFSRKANLVNLLKNSMKNEIRLIEISKMQEE